MHGGSSASEGWTDERRWHMHDAKQGRGAAMSAVALVGLAQTQVVMMVAWLATCHMQLCENTCVNL